MQRSCQSFQEAAYLIVDDVHFNRDIMPQIQCQLGRNRQLALTHISFLADITIRTIMWQGSKIRICEWHQVVPTRI